MLDGAYMKKPVTYLGYQEGIGLLVNEVDSHSTVTYDEEKHCIVQHCMVDDNKPSNTRDAWTFPTEP